MRTLAQFRNWKNAYKESEHRSLAMTALLLVPHSVCQYSALCCKLFHLVSSCARGNTCLISRLKELPMKSPLLVLCAFSLFATTAYADTFQNFDYEGTFQLEHSAITGTVSGSLTIDTTMGIVTDGSPFLITLTSQTPFLRQLSTPPEVFPDTGFLQIGLTSAFNNPNSFASVALTLPVTTLIGYTGSILCTEATYTLCPDEVGSGVGIGIGSGAFITGSIAPATATPEPSTLGLLSTGVFALAGTVSSALPSLISTWPSGSS